MNHRVLILNQDYSVVSICSIRKAFILIFLDKAELIAKSKSSRLRTVSTSFDLPTVIRLIKYAHIPYRGVEMSRQNIFKRDYYLCQYCGSRKDLTIDHVLPSSRGGKSNWGNLVTACRPCNTKKGRHTPEEAGMLLTKKPFKPSFLMFLRDFSKHIQEDWKPYLGKKSEKLSEEV